MTVLRVVNDAHLLGLQAGALIRLQSLTKFLLELETQRNHRYTFAIL